MIFVDEKFSREVLGDNGQIYEEDVAIEELSELTKAIVKQRRFGNNTSSIVEEMADVYICLKHLQIIYRIDDNELQKQIDYKMERYNSGRGRS